MTNCTRVVIVDDHSLFLTGLARCFRMHSDFDIVGTAGTTDEACEITLRERPDILLLDIGIPGNGIKALERIVSVTPEVRVVMLTGSDDQEDVAQSLQAGAHGYILKGIQGDELVESLRAVLRGEKVVASNVSARSQASAKNEQHVKTGSNPQVALNNRDKQILELISNGLSNQEISKMTKLSLRTIKHRLSLIYRKLDVRSRFEAAIQYMRMHRIN